MTYGAAQRPGTKSPCAEAFFARPNGDRFTAAVVDGAGHEPQTVEYANTAAAAMTLYGMVAAANPKADGYQDDATAVVLRLHPEEAAPGETGAADAA
ncbi:hypothetical protein KNE206_67920 [Kitasatospora sp. NE20-6]